MERGEVLERIRSRVDPWDIIVIGGGATGVGCAVDAASRRYNVLLLERHDFGKGTSSRSTKLIHGGVRYLAQGNISLVRESLRERAFLLRNAPHIVQKQAFVVPCYSRWQKLYYGAGLKIYDLLAGKYSLGPSRVLTANETHDRLPNIGLAGLSGGILYYDARFDDTRLLIDLVSAAGKCGATALNYAAVRSIEKTPDGKIDGVIFEDLETGETLLAPARVVINATGIFCDELRTMSDDKAKPIVTLSRGIHLVLDGRFLASDTALMIPETPDGRLLFCIPWYGRVLIGTTDTPVTRANIEPRATDAEIDYILETAGKYLTKKPVRDDIHSIFAGIRPLAGHNAAKNTASLSRGHMIEVDGAGMVTITGGKWTTYRHMAEDAVDQAARSADLPPHRSVTRLMSIAGPAAAADRDDDLLHPDLPYTAGDVIRSVRDEMARTLEDVLARRTRALFIDTRAATEMAPRVAGIMAAELEQNEEWVNRQLAEFTTLVKGYRAPDEGGTQG